MEEKDLTPRQRKWLEASRKIGPLAITKTERETLEKLYADMLPQEQQELQQYIQEKYGKEDDEQEPQEPKHDPTKLMEARVWAAPSEGLKRALFRSRATSSGSFSQGLGATPSPEADDSPDAGDMSALLQQYRSLGEALAARGSEQEGGRIDACIARVEQILEEWDELRVRDEQFSRAPDKVQQRDALRKELHAKERDLEGVLQELKEMLEPS